MIAIRLIMIPLVVMFISIAIIGVISSLSLRSSLLKQTNADAILHPNKVASHVVNNQLSLRTINTMLEEKIIYSTVDSNIGSVLEKGNPADNFRLSEKNKLMDEILIIVVYGIVAFIILAFKCI